MLLYYYFAIITTTNNNILEHMSLLGSLSVHKEGIKPKLTPRKSLNSHFNV